MRHLASVDTIWYQETHETELDYTNSRIYQNSRTIIKNYADIHLFSIVIACVPIQMHHGQAVLAFVPDPGFSTLRFVRDMLSMRELDDPSSRLSTKFFND